MSDWVPSEGLKKSELLVQTLEVEARAAGSVITPVFRHRMVEMIAKTLDGGVVGSVFTNGHDAEAAHAKDGPVSPVSEEEIRAGMETIAAGLEKTTKGTKGKPAKKAGKRGRPSKAEIAARNAAHS